MLNDEIVSVLARFFEGGRGPSHDELTRAFRRFKLDSADPLSDGADPVGKMKRVRDVLSFAIDSQPANGEELAKTLLASAKARGAFRPASNEFLGEDLIRSAQSAFAAEGLTLDSDGTLYPTRLEALDGLALTEALRNYVRRAQGGSRDAALLVGTSKDLLEATARHVLVEMTGDYPQSSNFPMTLYLAFDRLGLQPPSPKVADSLDPDPWVAVTQACYLLGGAVNRLRNHEGTGHGRPFPPSVTETESEIAIQAMGLVSQLLLVGLERSRTPTK